MHKQRLQEDLTTSFKTALKQHKEERGDLIALLNRVQEIWGYIPEELLPIIAEESGKELKNVQSIIKFNSCYSSEPPTHRPVQVCVGHSCSKHGSLKILQGLRRHLDKEIDTCQCFGNCANAAVVKIDGEVYGHMDLPKTIELLDEKKS